MNHKVTYLWDPCEAPVVLRRDYIQPRYSRGMIKHSDDQHQNLTHCYLWSSEPPPRPSHNPLGSITVFITHVFFHPSVFVFSLTCGHFLHAPLLIPPPGQPTCPSGLSVRVTPSPPTTRSLSWPPIAGFCTFSLYSHHLSACCQLHPRSPFQTPSPPEGRCELFPLSQGSGHKGSLSRTVSLTQLMQLTLFLIHDIVLLRDPLWPDPCYLLRADVSSFCWSVST